jgi:glutaredoxin-related protein
MSLARAAMALRPNEARPAAQTHVLGLFLPIRATPSYPRSIEPAMQTNTSSDVASPRPSARPAPSHLDGARIAAGAARRIADFHSDIVRDVEEAVARSPVVVVGMAQNPHVKTVRRALTSAGVEFTYLEYGSYFAQWKERLAIKLWTGWPTFPQVFVRGVLIGGTDLTLAALADGSLLRTLQCEATAAAHA